MCVHGANFSSFTACRPCPSSPPCFSFSSFYGQTLKPQRPDRSLRPPSAFGCCSMKRDVKDLPLAVNIEALTSYRSNPQALLLPVPTAQPAPSGNRPSIFQRSEGIVRTPTNGHIHVAEGLSQQQGFTPSGELLCAGAIGCEIDPSTDVFFFATVRGYGENTNK